MVQILYDPTINQGGDGGRFDLVAVHDGSIMTREDHAQKMRELQMKRSLMKTPRRGWSLTDYQDNNGSSQISHVAAYQVAQQPPIPEHSPLPSPTSSTSSSLTLASEVSGAGKPKELPTRPKLPPPRRSYSVMDYEPVPPGQPKPSTRFTILDLPPELHYALFDFLDPIDGVCFGLAHSRLYAIHRRKYGTVPLFSRYSGPNDMEWAWRGAGPLVRREAAPAHMTGDLERLRLKGQVYCRKCGVSRCELHRHLRDWMGGKYEYCEIRKVYGPPASADAKDYCYMTSPKNPHRCGRHGAKKMS